MPFTAVGAALPIEAPANASTGRTVSLRLRSVSLNRLSTVSRAVD